MEEQSKKSSGIVWIVVIVVVLALAGAVFAFTGKKSTPDTTTTLPPPVDTTGTPPADNKSTYKDGTYTSIGNYYSPGGAEQIKVTITLTNDLITDATVMSQTTSGPQAIRFQGQFISGFKSQVIGKNIADVTLSRVSGSSLTPNGWNDAIAKIEAEAKA